MPITITLPQPGNIIGPGLATQLQSSFIGPLGSNAHFLIQLTTDSEGMNLIASWFKPTTLNGISFSLGTPQDLSNQYQFQPKSGDTAYVQSQLSDGTSIVDSGTQVGTWDSSAGLWYLTQLWSETLQLLKGQGLTTEQAAQLARTDTATQVPVVTSGGTTTVPLSEFLSPVTLDSLTLHEITSGPQFGFVSSALGNATVGLIVRITTLGAGYAGISPDDGWYRPELAVINFFRGSDLVGRVGQHTISRFIYPLPGSWAEWITAFLGGTLPPDYSVQVTFAAGNAGQVFYTKLP